MASLTWWTWVWASPGSWWWTRKTGMLQSIGSQRVRHNWATELNWAELKSHIDKNENFLKEIFLWLAQNVQKEPYICLFASRREERQAVVILLMFGGRWWVIDHPSLLLNAITNSLNAHFYTGHAHELASQGSWGTQKTAFSLRCHL